MISPFFFHILLRSTLDLLLLTDYAFILVLRYWLLFALQVSFLRIYYVNALRT